MDASELFAKVTGVPPSPDLLERVRASVRARRRERGIVLAAAVLVALAVAANAWSAARLEDRLRLDYEERTGRDFDERPPPAPSGRGAALVLAHFLHAQRRSS